MTVNANTTKDVWIVNRNAFMDFQSFDTSIPIPNITLKGSLTNANFLFSGPVIMGVDMASDGLLYGLAGFSDFGVESGGIYSIDEGNGELKFIGDTDHNWLGLAAVDSSAKTIIELDIKPQVCPNQLNTKNKGDLPVAILGTNDFDVSTIDIDTISFNGVSPVKSKSKFEDVTAPAALELPDCEILPPDTYEDLVLKFNTQEVVATLGEVQDGDIIELTLTGNLLESAGGTAIEGKDCVLIKNKGIGNRSYNGNGSSHKKKK
jgi:hypothetical protein